MKVVFVLLLVVASVLCDYHMDDHLYHHDDHKYYDHPAPVGHDGIVIDTPEVAIAKEKHFDAYHKELELQHKDHYRTAYEPLVYKVPVPVPVPIKVPVPVHKYVPEYVPVPDYHHYDHEHHYDHY